MVLSQTIYFRFCVMADMPLREKAGAQNSDKFQRGALPQERDSLRGVLLCQIRGFLPGSGGDHGRARCRC